MKIDITRRGVLAAIGATTIAPSALAQGAAQAVLYTSNPAQALETLADVAAKPGAAGG